MEYYIHDNYVFYDYWTQFQILNSLTTRQLKELALKPKQKEWEEYVSQFQQAGSKSATPENGRLRKGYLRA